MLLVALQAHPISEPTVVTEQNFPMTIPPITISTFLQVKTEAVIKLYVIMLIIIILLDQNSSPVCVTNRP